MIDTYTLIIAISLIIVASFFFNILSKKTNIPSVLMLIALGVGIKYMNGAGFDPEAYAKLSVLEVIGNVGLIMIVLEAALDLDLKKEKLPLIIRSFFVALIALVLSSFSIAYIIISFIPGNFGWYEALVYAVPLSIMSSAIIIPSVGGLKGAKKEFMVYESTFSDILGIMFFYFLVGVDAGSSAKEITFEILLSIGTTVAISFILSYLLVYVFQSLTSQVKLFLIIAILMLVYAVGKSFHLSSLLIILVFGLILNNTPVFFRGKLSKHVNEETVKPILHDFHILTLESAFVVRTFFFVLFGMFISLSSLIDWKVAVISVVMSLSLYVIRFLVLKIFINKDIVPQLFIAPRGLITILLFFTIKSSHENLVIEGFDEGILLFVILITSIIMTIALIRHNGDKVGEVLLSQMPSLKVDKNKDGQNDKFEDDVKDNVENRDFNNF